MSLNRFLCLSLGAYLSWFTGVAHAQFNNIIASPSTLFVNTATNVKFVADVKPDPKLIGTSVRLLRENNGVWGVVGTMRDDGLSGDDVAGDKRFTLISSVQSLSLTTLNFRATAAYSGVLKRVQSSILPLDVIEAFDLDIQAGQTEVTLVVGESAATAFTLLVSNQSGGQSVIAASQEITPDMGGISTITDLPTSGFTTSQANQTFLVQSKFTGIVAGEYLVKLDGTLTAGAKTDQASATIKIHVLPASGIGKLGMTTYPGGIKTGTSANITFGARYTVGTAIPTSVQLVEVTAQGVPIQVIGSMQDDGVAPDIGAADRLFTALPLLVAGPSGTVRYFRAIASFTSGETTQSLIVPLQSLPYDIGFAPINVGSIIQDPATGERVLCDQLLVTFVADTPINTIQSVATSISGSIVGVEPAINTYQISIPCTTITGLLSLMNTVISDTAVLAVAPNSFSDIAAFPDDPQFWGAPPKTQYAPRLARADEAWLIARGTGITVAVLDTGVDYNHEDLKGRVSTGWDYINKDNDPIDDDGHGTHVAGIIAAKGNNGKGVAGVAWDAQILAIKVCGGVTVLIVFTVEGCPDSAATSGILEATSKATIINMSFGGFKSFGESFLNAFGIKSAREQAIVTAKAAGVMVVASAGNENSGTPSFPCAYDGVFCVGNSNVFDTRHVNPLSGSNFGPHVDIAAPGTEILSTVPSFYDPSGYDSFTGTSMAAPFVAGVAALVWANNPAWTYSQVEERLLKTAKPLPGQQIGPRVDAFDAVFNGSFTHDLSGWTVIGTGSAVDKLSSIIPTTDKRMGMVSTGPDGAVSSSDLFQMFTIQPDVTELALSFRYAMITEEYPEWVNLGFNDDFRVTLEAPGGTTEIVLETVDGSAFIPISGIDFPGGDLTVGWTGWKSIVSKKIPVVPGGGTYRLRVRDRGDGIYDTNGVLDYIQFK